MTQTGTATYTMEEDGTGTISAEVVNAEVGPGCAQLDPPLVEGGQSIFEVQHAVDGEGSVLSVVTGLRIPAEPDTAIDIPVVMDGVSVRQGPCTIEAPQTP